MFELDKLNFFDEIECLWFSNKMWLFLIIFIDGLVVFFGLEIKICIYEVKIQIKIKSNGVV